MDRSPRRRVQAREHENHNAKRHGARAHSEGAAREVTPSRAIARTTSTPNCSPRDRGCVPATRSRSTSAITSVLSAASCAGTAARPWNKVYAEICAGSDRRSLTGIHLRDHVAQEVAFPGDLRHCCRFHVDRKGFPPSSRRQALPTEEARPRYRSRVNEDLRYERINGSWFALERSRAF